MTVVEIGHFETVSSNEEKRNDFQNNCLSLFLYTIYCKFLLERNNLETFIGPRDEMTILRLALSQITSNVDLSAVELQLIWIEVCKRRLFGPQGDDCGLANAVDDLLLDANVVDRVHLLKAIMIEYNENYSLKEALQAAEYVIISDQLSWFEFLVTSLLIELKVPNLRFTKTPHLVPFRSLHQCEVLPERYIEPDPLARSLLAYLAVSVNVMSTIDLALIMNSPFRGFGKTFFSVLRRAAKRSSISPGQLVLSYPACMTDSTTTSTLAEKDDRLLRLSAPCLGHLADTIRGCQDALSGHLNDEDSTLATTSEATCMSIEAATRAVGACLDAAVQAFSKPPSFGGRRMAREANANYPLKTVKEVREKLCQKLKLLVSSSFLAGGESILTPTPNRPTRAGGSIQGRAAFKLARFFIFSEASAQLVQLIRTPSEASPWRIPRTPFGQRTIRAFFQSPTSAERTPKATTPPRQSEATATSAASEIVVLLKALSLPLYLECPFS
uniref:Origin recognition complex subunit 3 n=1 Tax=Mesocestoides corti TaxID=53468 RepID=A0A5K3EX54_MESCO